ncbi:RNA polymerase sigma factor for flagellar operon FliA [[Clostridium] sordellii]|uniref:RNA polymerase sigma factor for flagellar operon FliA n=2 Tax=Paraclostridium sordellii TaxID=1505 RepID=A0A0A1SJR3_PARSO|nr:FliA/WhiG family RNA polymerase sigma factor [Paeniclostridium sordellii]EPZ59821.1 RNA polymerase sigma factor, FliA/WhiG family protein [[Clostridium] sordellii VPI 9048] [Paeniclostridium sordellii VPI 9048]CEJ74565.1 RNA polymerase sigma-28factor for flagellar operon [[Clostridium] sordellii] [Paeniclostridium sordellii]CEK32000.1 RNA polymerase sigma factor for flagellar operon FliA [[Clostridium] sordellii] [Paeniclostridium sordellii]CEK32947.1 RNA polymerase sigma factor for flagella
MIGVVIVMISKEELINQNMPIVKSIASKYYTNKIGMEYEDLVSYGVMGLLDASDKFDEEKGVKFSTYASIRITSYIIDEIRKQSPVSRGCLSKVKSYKSCVEHLQHKYLRQPTIDEISDYMEISSNEVHKIKKSTLNLSTSSLDNIVLDSENDLKLIDIIKDESINIEDSVEKDELIQTVTKALDMLNERDRLVLSLYYYEELTLKEIGAVLGVSESRVSQLNKKAILNLKGMMKKLNYLD